MNMYNKTAKGALTRRAQKVITNLDGYIDYFEKAKRVRPARLILSVAQLTDLFDEEYTGDKEFRGIPVVPHG